MVMSDIVGLLIAALGGAAVGLERQWSGHAEGPRARFAGIRTFTLLGAIGGLSGWLWNSGVTIPAAILFAGGVTIVAIAYVAGSRQDIDGTTEVAALVVLPLLPEGPYGPFGGIRPRELWALVLFFSGLSFAGYLARRVVGPDRGYFVTGLLGGLISSTNVTWTFARLSRTDAVLERVLAFGAVAANAMLYPRVLIATAILNPAVVSPLVPYLLAPALAAALAAAIGARRSSAVAAPAVIQDNPLQLTGALQMAALFQAVLMAVYIARDTWGRSGVFTSAGILGLTDVDALTVSMAREIAKSVSPEVAATGIAVGVLTNTAMKLGLALGFGSRTFTLIAGGALLLMLVSLGAALAVFWG
jgi:uncharacterized membrane protein (DUF4010 family)